MAAGHVLELEYFLTNAIVDLDIDFFRQSIELIFEV